MLAQNHARRAQQAGHQEDYAQPPDGVVYEDVGEGQHAACHAADGRHVGRYLPERVDEHAGDLDDECREHDAMYEEGHVLGFHHLDAEEVAEYGDEVGHHASLLLSQLYARPALHAPIGAYEQRRQQDGEEEGRQEYQYLVLPGQRVHVGEQEQQRYTYEWQVERCEHHADDAGCCDPCFLTCHNLSLSYFLNLAMGKPIC